MSTPSFPLLISLRTIAENLWKPGRLLGAEPVNCVKLLGSDATKPAIEVALKHFIKGIDSGDTLVFFLAGNSVSFNELNHLVSHDTQLNEIQETSFQLGTVMNNPAPRGEVSEECELSIIM